MFLAAFVVVVARIHTKIVCFASAIFIAFIGWQSYNFLFCGWFFLSPLCSFSLFTRFLNYIIAFVGRVYSSLRAWFCHNVIMHYNNRIHRISELNANSLCMVAILGDMHFKSQYFLSFSTICLNKISLSLSLSLPPSISLYFYVLFASRRLFPFSTLAVSFYFALCLLLSPLFLRAPSSAFCPLAISLSEIGRSSPLQLNRKKKIAYVRTRRSQIPIFH